LPLRDRAHMPVSGSGEEQFATSVLVSSGGSHADRRPDRRSLRHWPIHGLQ
jgi:hypothetical protein